MSDAMSLGNLQGRPSMAICTLCTPQGTPSASLHAMLGSHFWYKSGVYCR